MYIYELIQYLTHGIFLISLKNKFNNEIKDGTYQDHYNNPQNNDNTRNGEQSQKALKVSPSSSAF